jgi:lon-related putative ATP-dependent protease
MTKLKALNHKQLRQILDISQLYFKTTNEIKALAEFIGQDRALEALLFGISVKSSGYNLYAMGPSGIGKRSLIKSVLTDYATRSAVPSDWCYVNNFIVPEKPIALQLAAGRGFIFQQDMKSFMNELESNLLTIFESDEYRASMRKISNYYDKKRKLLKINITSNIDKTPQLYKEQHKKEKQLQRKVITAAVKPVMLKLKKRYAKFKPILKYLSSVYEDIISHVDDFINHDEKTNLMSFSRENPALTKYKINLIVDNRKLKGAPVIFEELPNYSNLICRIEHDTIQGSFTTNFNLIKAGSLHHANGGYLIIEARKFKKNIEAWEALKSALYSRKISIKGIDNDSELVKPVSLEPLPIPLNIKIILIGDRNTYYYLCEKDPDFIELFKVPVDFDEQIERNQKNIELYSRLIGTMAKKHKLLPFHAAAVAAIIDQSSRLADDVEKLSTQVRNIEDLVLEADYWAKFSKKQLVRTSDVKRAIEAKIHRMDRSRELYYEDIQRNFIIINTTGKSIGQVNCLSVRRVGDYSYGHPTRVTARVRLGIGKIIDIQREIKMAGPLHTKAGLIIANFLASRFNYNEPFALLASIAFEQIYCWTDGDSASVGELCALLSALSEIPINQGLAITGSIDQYGEVQAIGGVNEKIEGFFDVCKSKGLDGNQGVLIPAVNIKNLMLREDIVAAAKARKFFIYPITTIDEAISQLTGWQAGTRDNQGNFPENTVYYRIEACLHTFAKNRLKKI